MSLFIDKNKRRKSPIALAAFGAALLDLLVFAALYGLLSGPLYRTVRLGSEAATTLVHALVIAGAGTAVGCLLFLLPDKRVAPCGFAGLAVVLLMFYGAALMLEADARGGMLRLITLFGLAPVLVGNAVAWPVYGRLRKKHPPRRKTLQEEIREAAEKERKRRPAPEPPAAPARPQAPEAAAPDAALFGPGEGTGGGPASPFRSAQEEAMLFYDDEENDD